DLDGMAILPLNDWVPLFHFAMTYGDDPAPRVLKTLNYRITSDNAPERSWPRGVPSEDELLEFGLFWDNGPGEDGPDQILQLDPSAAYPDNLLLTWDNHGYPYDTTGEGDLDYQLDFLADIHDRFAESDYTPYSDWVLAGNEPWNGYIVAFRTSSVWSSGTSLGYSLYGAAMWTYSYDVDILDFVPIGFPLNAEGEPIDSYSPDFLTGESLIEEVGYSSSFSIVEMTGSLNDAYDPGSDTSVWNWPNRQYTPVNEHTRPRWDGVGNTIQFVFGEYMDMRQIFAMDTWRALYGINVHGSCADQIDELNMIFTDIGADPYGLEGNGGFYAPEALEHFTNQGGTVGGSYAVALGRDYAYNGVWLYYDTGSGDSCGIPVGNCPGNARFDPPTMNANGSTTFTDYPMIPDYSWGPPGEVDGGRLQWEYIPFPPGGGDPWWKIKLKFSGGRRRALDDTCLGTFENTPDSAPTISTSEYVDYFVVFRADSGYRDVSGLEDNVPMQLGADFRAFIEPRRRNSLGYLDGGIHMSGSLAQEGTEPWQNDPLLDVPNVEEPWWSERSANPNMAKPMRNGIEIHDLALTYSTGSLRALVTPMHHAQGLFQSSTAGFFSFFAFDFWLDPFGVLARHFFFGDRSYITPDRSAIDGYLLYDGFTNIQFAFETVPFYHTGAYPDVLDQFPVEPRSQQFPSPPPLPTLPEYQTWPPQFAPVAGFNPVTGDLEPAGHSYLYSAGDPGDPKDDVFVFEVPSGVVPFPFNGYVGYWLIDQRGGKWRILSNTSNQLFLRRAGTAGTIMRPFEDKGVLDGPWLVAKNVIVPGAYPRLSDWPAGLDPLDPNFAGIAPGGARAARLLKQRADTYSVVDNRSLLPYDYSSVAMLGFNLVGADDPVVNLINQFYLQSITVAFWGPDFDPRTDLQSLDVNGSLPSSGVLLYEDRDSGWQTGGVFSTADTIVPLEHLQWRSAPEPIDLDGDFAADDLDGDGVADEKDYAWVLRLTPRNTAGGWLVPVSDTRDGGYGPTTAKSAEEPAYQTLPPEDGSAVPTHIITMDQWLAKAQPELMAKNLAPGGNKGDDLFLVVRPSRDITRFQNFRVVVPATLPSRTPITAQKAGVIFRGNDDNISPGAFEKSSPEEGAVQDY
ncbi:MAG: hypothetical protein GWP08_20075, partial [Nitrospiraceae bacterium]|nr:hypothetical protein [Nitrospiraceae bacterium]